MIRHDIADLDPSTAEFVRTRAKMMIPADGGKKVYFCNEGNNIHWGKPIKDSVESFKGASAARYVGSIVANIHRPLLYGGIYLYPTDSKSPKVSKLIIFVKLIFLSTNPIIHHRTTRTKIQPSSASGSASPSRRRRRSLSCCPLCSRGRFHRRPPQPFRSSRWIHPPHAASSSSAGDTRTEQRRTRCTTCQDTSTDARPLNGQRGSSLSMTSCKSRSKGSLFATAVAIGGK